MQRPTPRTMLSVLAVTALALLAGPLQAAEDAAAGLPLKPTRVIEFDTDQGTWLSVDVDPSGQRLVFDLLGDLYRLDAGGGKAVPLTRGLAFDSQPAWSPDGARVAFLSDRSGAENLWTMAADGSDARQLTSNQGPNEFISPHWSRDGQWLYVSLYRADHNAVELWRYQLATGRAEELSQAGQNALGAAPSPDGRYVYYAARRGPVFEDEVRLPLWSIERRDLATGRVETTVNNVGSAMRPVLSPDGRLLAYAVRQDGQTGLRLRNLATGEDRLLLYPVQHDVQEAVPTRDLMPGYAFTPDGAAIVTTRNGGIVRVPVATGVAAAVPFQAHVRLDLGPLLRQSIAADTGPVRARLIQGPRPSPDGKALAFSALGRIYRMDLRPNARPQRLTQGGDPEFHPAWSPDGRALAYVTWTSAGGAIWIAESKTGRPRRVTAGDAYFYSDVSFAPDGKSLLALRSSAQERNQTLQEPLWTTRTSGYMRQADLVQIDLAGGGSRVVCSGALGSAAQFTGEADRLYLHTDAGLEAVARDGSWRKPVLKVVGPGYYFLDALAPEADVEVGPDGRHALVLFSQQLYVVELPAGAEGVTIDLTKPDARVHRVTPIGADFAAWSADGRSLAWALGSTYHRARLADVLASAAGSGARPVPVKAERFEARVEVPRDTPNRTWVLRGATLITMRGDEVLRDADLVVRDDRIAALGPRGAVAVPRDAAVVDATGRFVMPGLIDAHDHIGNIRRNVLQLYDWGLRARLAFGITSVLDPSSLSIDMFAYEDLIDAGQVVGPRLYTTGMAMFSYNRLQSLDDARDLVTRYRVDYRTRNLKQYRIGSRRERQWIAMAAREQAEMPTTEGAVDMKLGLTQVLDGFAGNEHAFGVFPLYRDVVELMARAGTSTVLTLMISHGGPPAGPHYIEDSNALADPAVVKWCPANAREHLFSRAEWVSPRDYVFAPMAAGAAAIQRAGGLVGIGAHGNYPGIGTHWELQAHVAGGMTPREALHAATIGSATVIGRQAELGSLEPGKFADFVVLDANPLEDVRNTLRIDRVVKGGRVYDERVLSAPAGSPK